MNYFNICVISWRVDHVRIGRAYRFLPASSAGIVDNKVVFGLFFFFSRFLVSCVIHRRCAPPVRCTFGARTNCFHIAPFWVIAGWSSLVWSFQGQGSGYSSAVLDPLSDDPGRAGRAKRHRSLCVWTIVAAERHRESLLLVTAVDIHRPRWLIQLLV